MVTVSQELEWLKTQLSKSRRHRQKTKGCCVKVDETAYNQLVATASASGETIRQAATAAIMSGHGLAIRSPEEATFFGMICRLRRYINDGNPDLAGSTAAEAVLYGLNHPTDADVDRAEDWARVAENAAIIAKYCATVRLLDIRTS